MKLPLLLERLKFFGDRAGLSAISRGGVLAVCGCDVVFVDVGWFETAVAEKAEVCWSMVCAVRVIIVDCKRGRGNLEDSAVRNSRICAL